jgi:hypothetical protein
LNLSAKPFAFDKLRFEFRKSCLAVRGYHLQFCKVTLEYAG